MRYILTLVGLLAIGGAAVAQTKTIAVHGTIDKQVKVAVQIGSGQAGDPTVSPPTYNMDLGTPTTYDGYAWWYHSSSGFASPEKPDQINVIVKANCAWTLKLPPLVSPGNPNGQIRQWANLKLTHEDGSHCLYVWTCFDDAVPPFNQKYPDHGTGDGSAAIDISVWRSGMLDRAGTYHGNLVMDLTY